ncbi:MAG TPA: hypothetical protein VF676_06465 [Flavobacterium sp.]
MNIFKGLFSRKKKEAIEVKNLTNSTVFILQTADKKDIVDISSIFNNNPYNDIVIDNPNSYSSSLATLSKNITRRHKTIETIKQQWGEKTWLNIHGGYDTGKSQLSLLISENLKYIPLSFSFKDISPNEFKNIIVLVFKQILANNLESKKIQLILFDDLPQLGLDDNVTKLFIELVSYCENNRVKVLSTSNYKINYKVAASVKNNFVELLIPLLNKEEIEEVISRYNDQDKAFKFATIMEAISAGYPVYVQIICQYLDGKGWVLPEDELISFISGKAFNELDDETYQKLLYTTQNESSREILYRLNLVLGTISNETIDIISNVSPVVNAPFEKVNSIMGTWLQKNSDETYFISPLIKRLGSNNVLPETRKEINNKLAHSILAKKILSQYDSQRAISYFIAGESFNDAGMIMLMALQSYFKNPEIFTESSIGSYWISTDLPAAMKLVTKLSLRALQLHILNDLQFKKHSKFNYQNKEFIRSDLERLVSRHPKEEVVDEIYHFSLLILFKSYISDDVKKSLRYLNTLSDIGFEHFADSEKELYNNLWLVLDKVYTIDEMQAWFESFIKIGKREDFYDVEMIYLFSRRLFDNIIEGERDWREKIEIVEFVEEKAYAYSLQLLGAYSVKTKIFIVAEKLGDLSQAEIYYIQIQGRYSKPEARFLITDELGRQQFYKGRNEEALSNLLEIESVDISLITKVDTYLTLAKIFGEKDKVIAHQFTKKAIEFSQNDLMPTKLTAAKLTGEYAISFWLLRDSKSAIYKLAECYEQLLLSYKQIDRFDNIDDYNIIVLQVGNAINYIYQILNFGRPPATSPDGSDYVVPKRGLFNNTYDPKLLHEWYYEERKFMNVYIFIQAFEYFNDQENSVKWANYAFEMNDEITLYTFKNTLRSFVGYKIVQNKYEETLVIEKDLKEFEEKLNIQMSDEITNSQQKEMFLALLERSPSSKDMDDYYITYNFIPIVLRELTLFLENKSSEGQIISNLKEHFLTTESLYADQAINKYILFILDNYPSDYNSCRKLIDKINELESDNKRPVQIIYCLICSLKAPTIEALKLHLALMPYLEKAIKGLSTGIYLFILYPFVYKFWTSRVYTTPQDFYFLELWQKNLAVSFDVKKEFKIVAIYSLICMHLAYRPNENEQSWMKDYINAALRAN